MAVGDNNPRVFAETVSLDAWRTAFDGVTGEADLHIDVVFAEKGRVGGGDSPVRFRLSLKRAEVHVIRDSEGVLDIKRSSVRRPSQPEPGKLELVTKAETKASGGLEGALSAKSATLSAKGAAEGSMSVTKTLAQSADVPPMEVTHWPTDRGYAFKIARRDCERLSGQPWDAAVPRMAIRDTNFTRKRGEPPEMRIEIHCLREDLVIEEIEFTSDRFPSWARLTEKKRVAVEQFLRDELARASLPCGDLSEPFTQIILGDALPAIEL